MRFAVALLFVVAGYLNSCASGPVLLLRVEEPTLSQADSCAVHIAARERLDMIAPRSRILEIRVMNANEVEARFDTEQHTYFMVLQKRAGQWGVIRIKRLSPYDIVI